ncbi:MAG: SEC-C metal-binding domain-containing protein, partial [Candidatus Saccharimonadales bacterium]
RQAFDTFQQFQVLFRKNVVYQIFQVLWQPTARLILEENSIAGQIASDNGDQQTNQTARQAATHSKRSKSREKVAAGKIGRNDPCYCNSGKKYKYCHGRG